jgi:hypothetical protein
MKNGEREADDRGEIVKPVQVRVLYSEDCPNAARTMELIDRIGRELGAPIAVEPILVATREEAIALRCLGSPTVQVNGLDVAPSARESSNFGLA